VSETIKNNYVWYVYLSRRYRNMPKDTIRMIASRMKTDVKKKLNIFNVYCNSCSKRRLLVTNTNSF